MLTDELLLLVIWGALKGVRGAQKEIRKLLSANKVEHQGSSTSMSVLSFFFLLFFPFLFFFCVMPFENVADW